MNMLWVPGVFPVCLGEQNHSRCVAGDQLVNKQLLTCEKVNKSWLNCLEWRNDIDQLRIVHICVGSSCNLRSETCPILSKLEKTDWLFQFTYWISKKEINARGPFHSYSSIETQSSASIRWSKNMWYSNGWQYLLMSNNRLQIHDSKRNAYPRIS